MNFNDLFFTLLLYRKVKTHQYRFYDCLVSHDGAYIDVNRFIEPTDTVTVSYKIGFNDAVNETPVQGKESTQQFILCARTNHADTNTILLSPYPYFRGQAERHVLIDNGGDGNSPYRLDLTDGFDTRVTVSLSPTRTECYIHNTESVVSRSVSRSLAQGASRALLKLFAGFIWQDGTFVYNGCTSRIYSCYIQDANEQYTMRLQPAEDLNTGELGMYDSINDKFYSNKNSIGYFTVEEDITDKIILDVESQIDTKRYNILCTSYNLPYQLNDNKLVLVKKHDLPPITEGFIDLWDGMGKQSDEVGIFNNVTLQRNDTGDVTYTDNADGSVSVSVPNITGHETDFTRWAYKLANVAVGSIVIVGKCSTGFVIMNYLGVTPSFNGSFRWFRDGRIQNNITEDYEDATYSSIFTAKNPHTYTASGSQVINGGTVIGAIYNSPSKITIYGMALYTTILTKEQLLEVAHWLDRYVKRPQAVTRSLGEELQP